MKNFELSYCKDCGECSTAALDGDNDAYCQMCDGYDLLDMSDGGRFVPVLEGED